jgi:enoyl-CoA hydratase/carnithine racemase
MENQTRKVLSRVEHGNLILILNNPDKLNCIGMEMLNLLNQHLEEAIKSDDIKVITITGMGEKSFSSGADLKEFGGLTTKQMEEWIKFGNTVFNKIENLPKPTVALINGFAIGGGLEMALTCDFRLGTENAVMFSPEVKNGWLPGWGGMTRLRRMFGEPIAKEIILMGRKIEAEEASKMKLLNKIVSQKNKENELQDFIKDLTSINPAIYSIAKQAILDRNRTTEGIDLEFDILALKASSGKN